MVRARVIVAKVLKMCEDAKIYDWTTLKLNLKDALAQYLFDQTRRRPMIMPIIIEV